MKSIEPEVRSDPAPLELRATPMLSAENAFKLGVFGVNNRGGIWYVDDENAIRATWAESRVLATAADEAGLDAIIPNARWKGLGGRMDFNSWGLESQVWAAAVAAVTSRIQVITTVHVPTIHPVRVAKECATLDQISNGRFGLNVVAGWNQSEMEMFGRSVPDHGARYAFAEEWMELVERLWGSDEEFDFEGEHFSSVGAFCGTDTVQRPRPLVMNAAISKTGRQFATRHADVNFMVVDDPSDIAGVAAYVRETKEMARRNGREIKVMASVGVVCAETEAEARRRLDHYVHDLADWEGVRNFTGGQQQKAPDYRFDSQEMRVLMGSYALPLVGSPEQVVEGFQRLADAGVDGAGLSWVDYYEGIQQYGELLKPLLIEAGLRSA